ncbi:melanophilin isoform X1 [Anguilla rostrata]|uniref:melanophilin isoform X1 n=1 Tax=Anguilla rostrata TaxID=7938 RepID=UPI0030CE9D5F
MMPGTTAGKKLDLSRLTDEEAKHVWEVIQRDFDLRKKEEDRLGELKTKVEKEDAKRELLGTETNLADSHCIRCLHPFKFLVNSKRQCLDCRLYACKACCRYNKKERGWVCDSCRMARMLKIGTLEWYHENVRVRFKRFGSAKVMRSLYKRLNGMHGSQPDLRGPRDEDTHSMPDVLGAYDGHDEDHIDASDGQRYRLIRKTKRLLSVHPLDFDLDNEYATHSRRQSLQYPGSLEGMTRRRSMMAEADVASVFQQILEEQAGHDRQFNTEVHLHVHRRKSLEKASRSDDGQFSEHRMMRSRSLSKIIPPNGPQRHYYHDMDSSEEEEGQRAPLYQLPPRRRSHASSQENVHQAPPQINELNKRMSAIESLLNRLEQKMTIPPEQPASLSEAELEERKLRRKLDELTGNISDKGLSSDDEEAKKAPGPKETPAKSAAQGNALPTGPPLQPAILSSSSDELPSEAQKVCTSAGKPYTLEKKQRALGEATKSAYSGTTDSELSELEDKVAWAAAKVHNTESEVSDIENRIAALSAAGMSVEKSKKRPSGPHQRRKAPHDFPLRQADLFMRNSIYRGSLTQRNPVAKDKPKATSAKPVLAQAL